jgi:CHAT domain-containing protein
MVWEGLKPKLIKYTTFRRPLFSVRSRWSHFSLLIYLLVIVLMFACLLASCETGRQTISLDEAKQISLQFSDASFVPPPRSIKDLVPELSMYFGDKLRKDCASKPRRSLEEISKRFQNAPPHPQPRNKSEQFFKKAIDNIQNGNFSRSIQLMKMSIEALPPNSKGALGNRYAELSRCYAYAGDFKSAKSAFREALNWYGQSTYDDVIKRYYLSSAKGLMEQTAGNLDRAEQYFRDGITALKGFKYARLELIIRADLIENLMLQGRLLEAEALVRELVLDFRIIEKKRYFKGKTLLVLSRILFKQGRYSEAEYVAKAAINTYIKARAACSSVYLNLARQTLAKSMMAQERWQEALAQFDAIREGMKNERDAFKTRFGGDVDWALALLATDQVAEAKEMLEYGLERTARRLGQKHYRTAEIRGLIAAANAAEDKKEAALEGFTQAVPILLEQSGQAGDKTFTRSTQDQRFVHIIESYMNLLADIRGTPLETRMSINAAGVSFALADFVRARSVQLAVAASSARHAVKDAELADLIRREQDAGKQLGALYGTLSNAVSQAPNPEVIQSLEDKIDKLNKARLALIQEIESRFPEYAKLITPDSSSLEEVRATLVPEESLLSIYVGRHRSFIWALPYQGEVAFASVPLGKKDVADMVARIRSALEPSVKTLGEIPRFDLDIAYALFQAFLEPVKGGWEDAKSLLVVPSGALGYLPLSLLPTKKTKLSAEKKVLLQNYQDVPWLIRSHAVTVLPSVSTLTTLRSMPQGDPARLAFVGFGDPYFSEQQAKEATKPKEELQTASLEDSGDYNLRGLSIERIKTEKLDSAKLEVLPRLPETAEEIQSMALAMNADITRDVFIGVQANEQQVKTLDLSRYKVVAFATHGLAPGDLNGLLQPALALSAPEVADIDGDGLLTMEEILALRLNADWVVLSACNTGAGKEQGAEALSGLSRAFFYAGARALLVSNWPVETTSAKALTTDLFKRQAQNPMITKAEALRQSMLSLIDGVGYVDASSGKVAFSYAHPIFWAPFSLVGD